jgi:HicA-like toxin of HicAB toxin-antitoxin system
MAVSRRVSFAPGGLIRQVNQVGSHIILQTEIPQHHRLSVPDHKPLRIGTLNAILREVAAAKGVTREDILATLN